LDRLFLIILSKKILFVIICFFAAFFTGEFALRFYDVIKGRGFFSKYRNPRFKKMKPLFSFRTNAFDFYREKNGIRYISSRHGEMYPFDKPEGSFRIVCLGGSATMSLYKGIHYPLILQEVLRERLKRNDTEIINASGCGWGSPHSVVMLKSDIVFWKPDLLILMVNTNDLFTTYWPRSVPVYSSEYDCYFIRSRSFSHIMKSLLEHSELFWFLQYRLRGFLKKPDKGGTPKQRSYNVQPDPKARKAFKHNLTSFVRFACAHKIPVILSTMPIQRDEEFLFRHISRVKKLVFPLHHQFLEHHDSYNKAVKEVAEETGHFFIDADELLGGRREYFTDFVHYSEQGLHKMAEIFSDFIAANEIIDTA
jgi:hypothetical protein